MLQDNLMFVILIAIVGVGALTVNYIITSKELHSEAVESRLAWLKQQCELIFTALKVLKEIGTNPELTERINNHVMAMYDEVSMLAPDSELLAHLTDLREACDKALPTEDAVISDKAVKTAQVYLAFAEKLVIQLAKGGRLNVELAKSFRKDIHFQKIAIVVDAHLVQAKSHLEQDDKITALTHFKHAKAILMKANAPRAWKASRLDKTNAAIEALQPKRAAPSTRLVDSIDRML